MPSSPSILTDDSATFAGYPELATKVDESAVADADLDEYAGAAYPNFVDVCLKDLNKAARGEKNFTPDGVPARFSGAPDSGWQGTADDIVVGTGTLSRGMTFYIPNDGSANWVVRTPSQAHAASIGYGDLNKNFVFVVNGTAKMMLDSNALFRPTGTSFNLGKIDAPWNRIELAGNFVMSDGSGTSCYQLFRDGTTNVYSISKFVDNTLSFFNYTNSGERAICMHDGGGITIGDSGENVGFYGETPQPKPTVTGSRSSGAALESLLTALDTLGLITNNTTA